MQVEWTVFQKPPAPAFETLGASSLKITTTMTRLKYYFYFLTTLLFFACGQRESIESNDKINDSLSANKSSDTLQVNSDSIHWLTPKEFNPISFINAVTKKNEDDTLINVITMTGQFPDNWVKSSDIDTLMTLISSTKKCNCFLNPLSSYIPTNDNAEIGGYAIIFINSFRQKSNIDLGLYSCPKTDKKTVEEIKKWWRNYKQMK